MQRGLLPIIPLLIGALMLILGGGGYAIYKNKTTSTPVTAITSFEECAAAGYPVMESHPRQCGVPGGPRFTEIIDESAASCAAILCPTDTQCINGACIPLDDLIIQSTDPCMYTRCAAGYRCVTGEGRCEKIADACALMDCFEPGTTCVAGSCIKKPTTYNECLEAGGQIMFPMVSDLPRCQFKGSIFIYEEQKVTPIPNICAPPCTGMAPSREVTDACWNFSTQASCNAFTSSEFPYRCDWRPADTLCAPTP